MSDEAQIEREREFWDDEVISLEQALAEYREGPDVSTSAMLDALGDVRGKRVLDFACGAGVTSMWLAARGARVTALDLSPGSIARCRELGQALGLADRVEAVAGEIDALPKETFDGVVGRYALHHVDVAVVAPQLAGLLRPGGRGAFLETFASNPILRLSRQHLVGRLGVARYGTVDEHPLTRKDVEAVRRAFGWATTAVPRMSFLRILDRQVLRFRWKPVSRALGAVDDAIGARSRFAYLSYHQLLICGRPEATTRQASVS